MSEGVHYLEDFELGYRCKSASHQITAEAIIAFANLYDPQPMHLDEVAAQATPFKTLVASGWHTLCLTMRLMVAAKPLGDTPLIGVEVDTVRMPRPMLPDDEIWAELVVVGKRLSAKPQRGYLQVEVTTRNHHAEVLVTQRWTLLLPTRTRAPAERGA